MDLRNVLILLEEHLNNSGSITTRTEHSRKFESIQGDNVMLMLMNISSTIYTV